MDHTQYTTSRAERKPGKHLTREDWGAIEVILYIKRIEQTATSHTAYVNAVLLRNGS